MQMEYQTAETAEEAATLTILEKADDRLFDTFDAERPGDLDLYADATGTLFVTGPGADLFVRLEATKTGLDTAEVAEVDEAEMEEVEVTEPQETMDVNDARTRRRGD